MANMVDNELKNKLFQAGTAGVTFARDLLRSLLTIPYQTAQIVLDAAMDHVLIRHCFREEDQLVLVNDIDKWIGQVDDEKRNCHVQLLIRALQHRKFTIAPPVLECAMRAALAVNDTDFAEAAAVQLLNDKAASSSAARSFAAFDTLGRVYSNRGDFNDGLQYFLRGAEEAQHAELAFEQWDALTNAIWCLYATDRNVEALRDIEKAEAIARRLKRKGMVSKTLLDKGNSMMALGNIANAGPVFAEALTEAVNDNDLKRQSDALGNLGIIDYYAKKYETAKNYHLQALAISRQINDAESIQYDLNNLATAEFCIGLYDPAIEHKEEALRIAIARNDQAKIEGYRVSLQQFYQVAGKLQRPFVAAQNNEGGQPTVLLRDTISKAQPAVTGNSIEREVRTLLNANKFPGAVTLVTQHLKEHPGDYSVRCLYGALLSVQGNESGARNQFNEIIRQEPDNLDAYFRLFTSYQKSNEVSDILKDYQQKLFNEPYNAGIRMIVALASADSSKYDEAIQLAMAVANLRPQEELPYRVLAEVQWRKAMFQLTKNWEAAWITFNDCLAAGTKLLGFKGDNSAQWYSYTANIFQQFAMNSHLLNPPLSGGMGTPEIQILAVAMEYYKKSAELDQTRNHANEIRHIEAALTALAKPENITLTASYLLDDGHDETALVLLLYSLRADDLQAKAYQMLSKYFLKRGDTNEALGFLQKAIDIDPQNTEYPELKILYQDQVRFMNTQKERNANEPGSN